MAIKGLLLDLEGVLYQSGAPVLGAAETIRVLSGRGYAVRALTNTTTRPRRAIVDLLARMGLDLAPDQIFTPAVAARELLAAEGVSRIHLAAVPDLAEDFAGFDLVDVDARAVVLGDLHTGFTWARLNELFRMLRRGARLVALHRNRVCRRDDRIALDLGPFVAALEYAAGGEALVVGKPSAHFFGLPVADMGLDPGEVLMIGDDLEADIAGAQALGMAAVQVRTGKYSEQDDVHPSIVPNARLDSIADLAERLEAGDLPA